MKKFVTLIIGISLCLTVTAQQQNENKRHNKENMKLSKEELIEKKCKTVANKLMLDEAGFAKFIPVYRNYLNELGNDFQLRNLKQDAEDVKDADIDLQVKNSIETARKRLDIREKYYNEFRKILSAKQAKRALNVHNKKGERHRKLFNKDGGKRKEMLKKHLNFSHDRKKLNDSQTLQKAE